MGADARPSARGSIFLSWFLQRGLPEPLPFVAPREVIHDSRSGNAKGLLSDASAAGRRKKPCHPELGGDDGLSCRSRFAEAYMAAAALPDKVEELSSAPPIFAIPLLLSRGWMRATAGRDMWPKPHDQKCTCFSELSICMCEDDE